MIDYGDDDEWKWKCHNHDDDEHLIIPVDNTQNQNEVTFSLDEVSRFWFVVTIPMIRLILV